MGLKSFIADRLANVMSGLGTTVDRRTSASYVFNAWTPEQAEAGYRTSWLVRKIVDIPALDMTRERRAWQAKATKIEDLEQLEGKLQLWPKLQRALILARLYGGAGIILGDGASDPMQPLDVERVKKDGLRYLRVLPSHLLPAGPQRLDPEDEFVDKPEYFTLATGLSRQTKLHPSRVVEFIGQPAPEGSLYKNGQSWFWGDPIMQSVGQAVMNADLAQDGFAALIDEAKLDILKMPDLTDIASTAEGETLITNRLSATMLGKSTWRALLLDKEDEWQQRQINWSGIPDIILTFLNVVSGAADIPVTRLLGQSPKGLASTGEGEERDYHAMIAAKQGEILTPALERIDELLIRSALGSKPSDVYFEYNPLGELSEKEGSAVEKTNAETLKIYADTGMIPEAALSKIAQNKLIEGGRWPGCEEAFEDDELMKEEEPDPEAEAIAKIAANENAINRLSQRRAITPAQAQDMLTDARPRSLYVRRNLLNGGAFLEWAKAQGFESTVPADDLHVTVLFSRAHVDWLKMGSPWEQNDKGELRVPPGGARVVEPLGDKGAIVLLFNSSALAWRHEDMVKNGASHDFSDYQPHVTITYAGSDVDLEAVEPYRGELVFGPEIFEEVDDDWSKKLVETGSKKNVSDSSHWHNQPRASGPGSGGGHWIAGGGSGATGAGGDKSKPLTQEAKDAMAKANEGKSIDELRLEAATNQVALSQLGADMEKALGVKFAEPPPGFEVKSRASIERKVRDEDYDGPHQLRDISRASFVVDSPEQADSVVATLGGRGQVYDRGWTREEKSGYLGRFIYLQHPNGGVSEIQLVPQGVAQLKMGDNLQSNGPGHALYEIMRMPSQPMEAREAAARKMRTLYNRAMPKPFYGVAGLRPKR